MKEERIKKLILEVLIGIAILCVGIFIPASEIIRVLMIVIGAITVAINGVTLISNIHGDVKEITSKKEEKEKVKEEKKVEKKTTKKEAK